MAEIAFDSAIAIGPIPGRRLISISAFGFVHGLGGDWAPCQSRQSWPILMTPVSFPYVIEEILA
jgi:hypothetical protein